MAMEDVGLLSFGIALPRSAEKRHGTTRRLLNGALLQLEREHFFTALHNK